MPQEDAIEAPHAGASAAAGPPDEGVCSRELFDRCRRHIMRELEALIGHADAAQAVLLSVAIRRAHSIYTVAAGRSKLAADAFAMRLMHLGFYVHAASEVTAPAVGAGDLTIVCSASGETPTVVQLAAEAARAGANVVVVTASAQSTVTRHADLLVTLNEYGHDHEPGGSEQFDGTLFEQGALVYFDCIVLMLQHLMRVDHATMRQRHTNLE